eukprot:gene381-2419_t
MSEAADGQGHAANGHLANGASPHTRVLEDKSPGHSRLFRGLPTRALEPKVFVPHEHVRGRVPRKIEIERRRREYEQKDVQALLAEGGVTLDDLGPCPEGSPNIRIPLH